MSSSDPPSGAPAPSNMAAKPSSATDEMLEPIVEPIKIGLANIDKKIRNLEKKKSRLDALRDEVTKSGKPLNKDQSVSYGIWRSTIDTEVFLLGIPRQVRG